MSQHAAQGWNVAAVFLGGGVGSVLRYALGLVAARLTTGTPAAHLPLGTLTANVLGCLLIGLASGVLLRMTDVPRAIEAGLLVGLLGGFTTFSSFKRETFILLDTGHFVSASAYVVASVLAGLAAVWIGLKIAGLGQA